MSQTFKKYFTVFLTLTTVVWSLGPVAPLINVAHAAAPVLSGGGPSGNQNQIDQSVPPDALIDVNSSEPLDSTSLISWQAPTTISPSFSTIPPTSVSDVFFIDANIGWASISVPAPSVSGAVYKTTDGGATWTAQLSGQAQGLNALYFTSSTVGWVVGDGGTIMKTTDGGTTWTAQNSGVTTPLRAIVFVTDTLGFVSGDATVGLTPTIRQTRDAGSTVWELSSNFNPVSVQSGGANASIRALGKIDASTFVVAGTAGNLFLGTVTDLAGIPTINYSPANLSQGGLSGTNFFDVAIPSASAIYIVGASGTILKTTKDTFTTMNGLTAETSGVPADSLFGVAFSDANNGFAVGAGGNIRQRTTSGGATWTTSTSGTSAVLTKIAMPSATTATVVGVLGTVLKLTQTVRLQANAGNMQNGAPAGASLCSSVAIQSNQQGDNRRIVCNLTTPMEKDTWHTFTVTTALKSTSGAGENLATALARPFRTGSFGGQNQTNTQPPQILNVSPAQGSTTYPRNAPAMFQFSTEMLSEASNANAVTNPANVIIRTMPTGADVCTSAQNCTLAYSPATRTLFAFPPSGFTTGTEYQICLKGNAQNTTQQPISSTDRCTSFTAAATDSTAPTVASTIPASGATGVSRSPAEIRVRFDGPMLPTGIVTNNTSNNDDNISLYVDANNNNVNNGETEVSIGMNYDAAGKQAIIWLNEPLPASSKICFDLTDDLRDIAQNAMTATGSNCFTTAGTADSTPPTVVSAFGNQFSIEVAFGGASLLASTATSAGNYSIACPVGGQNINLANKTFRYFGDQNKVRIDGLANGTGQNCRVTVGVGVTSLTGTALTSASNQDFTIVDAAQGGALAQGGNGTADFNTNTDQGAFQQNPERCAPRSRTASATGDLECEFSIPMVLPTGITLGAGSQFVITVPNGFNIASVNAPANRFRNADLNGPATNAPTLASATVSGQVITVTTGAAALAAGDHINLELAGFTNTSTASDNNRLSIVLKTADGVTVGQPIQAAPFAIGAISGDARTASGRVYRDVNNDGDFDGGVDTALSVTVFCDQRGGFGTGAVNGGHQQTTTNAGTGVWTINNLSNGQYECGLPPLDYSNPAFQGMAGGNQMRRFIIDGANATNVDFPFADLATRVGSNAGRSLVVNIANGPAVAEQVDVFCHAGQNDFQLSAPAMNVVTLANGSGQTTLTLSGGKTYECGMGPHIDFSNMTGGGQNVTPTFNFMPPEPQQVVVPSDSNPAAITFNLTVASNTITGTVFADADADGVIDSGEGLSGCFVDAFPLAIFDATTGAQKGGRGSFSETASGGPYTLKVSRGTYGVNAHCQGMPPSVPREVTIASASNATNVNFPISKASSSVAGQVLDDAGNALTEAGVDMELIASGGTCASFQPRGARSNTRTDSSGNFAIYAGAGTYRLTAHNGAYGQIACRIVVVESASLTGQNLQASSGGFVTISGTAPDGSFVGAFGTNGGNHTVAANGTYSLKVPAAGGYTVECFRHGTGPCGRQQNVNASTSQTVNFASSITTGSLPVAIIGVTDAFVDVRDSNGQGVGTGQNTSGVYTIVLPAPTAGSTTYTIRGGGPKYGDLCAGQTVSIASTGTITPSTITCTPPANLRTLAMSVADPISGTLAGASVTVKDSSGKLVKALSNGVGAVSLTNLQDGTYTVTASKGGYAPTSQSITVAGNTVVSAPIALTQVTAGSNGAAVDIDVTANSAAYAGTARVVATNASGQAFVFETSPASGDTTATLPNGVYTVTAYGNNGSRSTGAALTIANNMVSGTAPDLDLSTTISGFSDAATDSVAFTPKAGGLIKSESIPGLSVNFPASTMSTTDSNAGSVEISTDPSAMGIPAGTGLAIAAAYEVTPTDSTGKPLTSVEAGEVAMSIPVSAAQLSAQNITGGITVAAVGSNGELETLTGVYDETNRTVNFTTSHFSTFVILGTTSSARSSALSDVTAPNALTNVQATSDGSKVMITWTDSTDSDFQDVVIMRGVSPLPVTGDLYSTVLKGVKTFTDTAVTAGKTYKYILRARDTSGNAESNVTEFAVTVVAPAASSGTTATVSTGGSSAGTGASSGSSASMAPSTSTTVATTTTVAVATAPAVTAPLDARAAQLARIIEQAKHIVTKAIADVATAAGKTRNTATETSHMSIVNKVVSSGIAATTKEKVTAFVVYGTNDTQVHGAGQRAAVVNSFRTAYGHDPVSEGDWSDVLKLANGRFPTQLNTAREATAATTFERIYKRAPNRANGTDNAAIVTIAYGLQQEAANRNLAKEVVGIKTFTGIYGFAPTTASHWDAVRAIAYSGATR